MMAERMIADTVNLPQAFCEMPPRLQKAQARGIATTFSEQLERRGKTERWTHVWRG